KDPAAFHHYISKLWQEQITPTKLQETFQTFIDQKIDLSGVAKAEPTFDKATSINDDGLLVLEGHYADAPSNIAFRLKYVYEKPAWKLFGIKVNVDPSGATPGKVPSESEAATLVKDSLLTFNDAVQAKDFSGFHEAIADVWKAQVTPEKLATIFQSFIEQEINLAPIKDMTPKFDKPPALNDDGVLVLQGSYLTRASRLRFDLGYMFQEPEWKLVKVNVDVDPIKKEEESDAKSDEE
ncbi:MAG: hypothetical protein ABI946_08445, partial [Chthoniobacterales bacterium]